MYTFAPMINKKQSTTFSYFNNAFTDAELETIINYAKRQVIESARIESTKSNVEDIRRTRISWIHPNNETIWFYDRMATVARELNADFYNFDLFGFVESMQFAIYEGDLESHYSWHVDASNNSGSPRKLTLVLQLSDPSEYEGGELQLYSSSDIAVIPKQKGLVVAFPSFNLHRVTPVTKGTRYTIVAWTCGPAFR